MDNDIIQFRIEARAALRTAEEALDQLAACYERGTEARHEVTEQHRKVLDLLKSLG